jgi:drug/metabolite transporter (DMT)-like permease
MVLSKLLFVFWKKVMFEILSDEVKAVAAGVVTMIYVLGNLPISRNRFVKDTLVWKQWWRVAAVVLGVVAGFYYDGGKGIHLPGLRGGFAGFLAAVGYHAFVEFVEKGFEALKDRLSGEKKPNG